MFICSRDRRRHDHYSLQASLFLSSSSLLLAPRTRNTLASSSVRHHRSPLLLFRPRTPRTVRSKPTTAKNRAARHPRIAVTVYAWSYIFRVHGTHTYTRLLVAAPRIAASIRRANAETAPPQPSVQSTAPRSLCVQGKYRSTTQSRSIPSSLDRALSVRLSPRDSSQTLAFRLLEFHLPPTRRYLMNRRGCDQLLVAAVEGRQRATASDLREVARQSIFSTRCNASQKARRVSGVKSALASAQQPRNRQLPCPRLEAPAVQAATQYTEPCRLLPGRIRGRTNLPENLRRSSIR